MRHNWFEAICGGRSGPFGARKVWDVSSELQIDRAVGINVCRSLYGNCLWRCPSHVQREGDERHWRVGHVGVSSRDIRLAESTISRCSAGTVVALVVAHWLSPRRGQRPYKYIIKNRIEETRNEWGLEEVEYVFPFTFRAHWVLCAREDAEKIFCPASFCLKIELYQFHPNWTESVNQISRHFSNSRFYLLVVNSLIVDFTHPNCLGIM